LYKNTKNVLNFYFDIRDEFIIQILAAELKTKHNKIKEMSMSEIREQIMLLKDPTSNIDSDVVETSLLYYLVNKPSMILLKKKWFCITFQNDNLRQTQQDKNFVKEQIKTELINFFASQPYIIKTKDYENENSFSSISSILAEGFFINQANAELINLFRQKIDGKFQQYVTHNSEQNVHLFNFADKFSVKNYDKFAKILGQGDSESSNRTLTELVPTLTEMFGTDAKDIMFACLKDENEVTQAKGAIDTLYLVQDIKST
jgi:hypothetical protein